MRNKYMPLKTNQKICFYKSELDYIKTFDWWFIPGI